MAYFFGGNPFSSTVGQKIEQATECSLPSEDWSLNMEICDLINSTSDGPKDAMKAIKKRLSQHPKNFVVVMYTLIVLETCVKNCGKEFHVLACNKEFILELVKLIGPKNGPPTAVQEKVLCLVQSWADAFRNDPELAGVVQVYNELRQKGMEFPMTDLDAMAPIHTPERVLTETDVPVSCDSTLESTTTLTSDQLGKLTSELRVVEGNMTVLNEMLSELVPGKERPDEAELMKELHSTCQAMQERLVELISQLSNDEFTAELLRINDELNNLFLRYSRYEKTRKISTKEIEKFDNTSLIDLSDSGNGINSQLAGLNINTVSNEIKPVPSSVSEKKVDEFDMFAQSRNAYDLKKIRGSLDIASKDGGKDLSGNVTATAQPNGQDNMHSERDFDEMAAWLGEKPEESITSSEFEKFLAERAAAAEALPAMTESSNSMSSKKKEDDPMLAL